MLVFDDLDVAARADVGATASASELQVRWVYGFNGVLLLLLLFRLVLQYGL